MMSVRLLMLLQWLVVHTPVGLGTWIADRLGDVVAVVARRSLCAARSNMRHVLGAEASERQVRRTAHQVFHNVMRNYFDILRLGSMSAADLDRMVDLDAEGLAVMHGLANRGQGMLLVTPHWGSFDLVTHLLPHYGVSLMMLVIHFRPPAVAEFLNAQRGRRGSELVWIDDGLAALKKSLQALRRGGVVALLPDRNIDRNGIVIPFFGDDTVVATGMAKMALRGRVPVLPGFCYRVEKNRYALRFSTPIYPPSEGDEPEKVKMLTRAVFAVFEKEIARFPEQWTLLQPIWPDAPCPPDPGLVRIERPA